MTEIDPLRILQEANPVVEERLPDPARSRRAVRLYEEILATSRPRKRRLRGMSLFLGVVSVSTATAYALTTREVSKPLNVACHAAADQGAKTVIVAADRGSPEAACARVWASGAFGSSQPPPLRACVLDSGVVGVFPATTRDDPCEQLELPEPATQRPSEAAGDFIAFKDSVVERFLGTQCVDPGEAEAVVRAELARHRLAGWTVRAPAGDAAQGFSAARPCASLAFDQERHEVILVAMPPRQ